MFIKITNDWNIDSGLFFSDHPKNVPEIVHNKLFGNARSRPDFHMSNPFVIR